MRNFLVNPTGRFVIGGPMGDCGLTGRKIIVDTYGGMARHGGGAFSGKDPTKVDRSAAYAARWVAKNIVAAGLADRAEVQVAYAIGVAHPVSVMVETFGTEKIGRGQIASLVADHFDLRPGAFREELDLHRPIYQKTAAYGHFGRDDHDFTWERVDRPRRCARPPACSARRRVVRRRAPRAAALTGARSRVVGLSAIAQVEPITSARALRGPFDYLLPEPLREDVTVGSMLVVPFGARTILGVVTGLSERSEVADERLLAPLRALELGVPEELVGLARWVAAEYCSTLARALGLVLPPGATRRLGGRRRAVPRAPARRVARRADRAGRTS